MEVEAILQAVAGWAARQGHVCAVALVGSWARGAGDARSDLDLVVLSTDPGQLVERDGWWSFLGDGELVRTQAWGTVVERRVRLASALEIEFDIAPRAWARVPLEAGTRRVLSDGARSVYDPQRLLQRALASLET
jgi:predicted nucleotidyltransferase